jgi:putative transposase
LIHEESYLLLCMRYIELNPVRAAMVTDPADYRWSSYRTNALGQASELLKPHPIYMAISSEAKIRQERYRALFRSELDQDAINDIRLAINQNQALGDSRFHAEIEKRLGERRQAKPRGRPKAEDKEPVPVPRSQGQLDL